MITQTTKKEYNILIADLFDAKANALAFDYTVQEIKNKMNYFIHFLGKTELEILEQIESAKANRLKRTFNFKQIQAEACLEF